MPKCLCACSCGADQKMEEYEHLQKVTQFLIGLNESYSGIRSTILAKTPLPNINTTLALLMQDQRLKECSSGYENAILPETSSPLYANNKSHQYNAKSNVTKSNSKANVICVHRGGTGHSKDTCF